VVNLANQPRYRRISEANKGRPVPEARLPPMVNPPLQDVFWWPILTYLDPWRHSLCRGIILVWLDSNPQDSLDSTRPCSRLYWRWLQHRLAAMSQFPRRYLRPLCRERSIRKHTPAECVSRRFPSRIQANAPKSRSWPCHVNFGSCGWRCYSCALSIYEVWIDAEKEIQVCHCIR
jgi:hypothetical protein